MAFVYSAVPFKYSAGCGGTILSRKYVLTAAHCMYICKAITNFGNISCTKKNSNDFTIYVGSTIPENALYKVNVKRYFIHPNFQDTDDLNKCKLNYDIAILELRRPLNFSNIISSVKLPTSQKTRKTMQSCTVLGWGRTQGGQNSRVHHTDFLLKKLKSTKINVISTKKFLKHLQISNVNSSIYPDLDLCRDTHICAIDPKNGVCIGDSGGPLICNGVQVGIMSGLVTEQCVGPHLPSTYTRVDINLKWINNITTV